MGITPKVHRGYRLKQETADTIEAIARGQGLRSQAEVIDQWADEWAKKNGAPKGAGQVSVPGKKSGARPEVLQDDVPDEVMKARGKRILARPEMQVPYTHDQLMGMGVKKGSELKAPAKKAGVVEIDLGSGRIERKPITKPNGKI